MCLKNKSKGENKSSPSNTSEYRDVPNRTSAKVTPEPAPLIQESLKKSRLLQSARCTPTAANVGEKSRENN
jgi:hypothetical protein